jgi:phosphatidate cytidylyltransferase
LSGLIYVGLILTSILTGSLSFSLLLLAFSFFAFRELKELLRKNKIEIYSIYVFPTNALLIISTYLYLYKGINLLFLGILPLFLMFFKVLRSLSMSEFHRLSYSVFVVIYTGISLTSLYLASYSKGKYLHDIPLIIFVFLWTNDTFAYLSGKLFGKRKLYEKVSPNKTWEGLIGGGIFTLVAAFIVSLFYQYHSLFVWMGFAVIVVITGTLGDFFESYIKRIANVKNSGHIIPGHGGVLDRIDSLLLSSPFVFVYLQIIEMFDL